MFIRIYAESSEVRFFIFFFNRHRCKYSKGKKFLSKRNLSENLLELTDLL